MDFLLPSLLELTNFGKKALDWYKDNQTKMKYTKAEETRLHPALADFLGEYYSCSPLKRSELFYPVVALRTPESQERDVESILGRLYAADRADYVVEDKSYLDMLKAQGRQVYNGRTYVMDRLECTQKSQRLRCSLGWYYDAMTTCDIFEWETLTNLDADTLTSRQVETIQSQLKYRNRYHEKVPNPVFNGKGRSAVLSISTLIVFTDGSTYRALVKQRSGRTAAHPDLYHVVPSFIFQPVSGYITEEYSIRHNIFREYLEEVFGETGAKYSSGEIAFDYFYNHERLILLRDMLKSRAAELLLTGFAMNLLNLRPEICTLLLIHDEEWLKQRIVTNWEFLTPEEVYEQRREVVLPIDILQSDRKIASELSNIPGTFVPTGAAAFWLGIDMARAFVR